jgi:hypothetical protein
MAQHTEFIPYEQALELKELGFEATPLGGFRQDAIFYYENGELYYDYRPMYSSTAHEGQIIAPLYQQAFRWFREKYKLHGEPFSQKRPANNFMYAYKISGTDIMYDGFKTYEEVELACLKKLIEITKNK